MFRHELYLFWSLFNKEKKEKPLTYTNDKKKKNTQKVEHLVLNSIPLSTLKKITKD